MMMTFAEHDNDPGLGDAGLGDAGIGGTAVATRLPVGPSSRMRNWVSAALVLLVFAAGLVCGAAVVGLSDDSMDPEDWSSLLDRVAEEMQRKLDLTETQRADIEQVVRSHQPKLDQIYARTIQEMRTELQQVIEEMSAALTPEQAARFRAEAQPSLDEHFPAQGAAAVAEPQ